MKLTTRNLVVLLASASSRTSSEAAYVVRSSWQVSISDLLPEPDFFISSVTASEKLLTPTTAHWLGFVVSGRSSAVHSISLMTHKASLRRDAESIFKAPSTLGFHELPYIVACYVFQGRLYL